MLHHSIWQCHHIFLYQHCGRSKQSLLGAVAGLAGTWPCWKRKESDTAAGCDSRAWLSYHVGLQHKSCLGVGTTHASSGLVKDHRKKHTKFKPEISWALAGVIWGSTELGIKGGESPPVPTDFWSNQNYTVGTVICMGSVFRPNIVSQFIEKLFYWVCQ